MNKPRTCLLLSAAVTSTMAFPAGAAKDPGISQSLDTVIVGASRSQSRVEDMPLHTTIISREDIDKSPAQTLDQILRNIPGMNFTGVPATQSDPTGHQTRMRGLGNAKVLVLLDGVPIHDPFYLTTQWYKVPLSNIERVEVVRGGNSSLWGNMAVAGVVNIVSRRVRDNAGEVVIGAGSRGSFNVAATKSMVLSDGLGINLAVDRSYANGYQTTPAEFLWRFPAKQPVDARNTNFQLTAYFQPSATLSGYLRTGYHEQDQDISYRNGSNLQKSPDFSAGISKKLADGASLTANAWAQYLRFEKYNGAACYFQPSGTRCPATAAVTLAQVNANILDYYTQYGSQRYREQGASAIYSARWSDLFRSVQLGADYRHLAAKDLEFFYGAPTVQAAPQGNLGSSTFGRAQQTFAGLFAQLHINPLDELEVTLSGRYDGWRNSDRLNTRTTAAGVTSGGTIEDSRKSAFDPSVALRFEATREIALRAAAYKSFRAPGFNNTTRTFGAATPTIANPALEPENLRGWEAGADFTGGALTAGFTWFRYDIKNQIATFRVNSFATAPEVVRTICAAGGGANLTNCGGSANFYTNDQDGRSSGVEITAAWKLSGDLRADLAYTRTDSKLVRRGAVVTDPVGVQLVGVPKNLGTLGLTWKAADVLRVYAEARYIGSMPIDTTSVANTVFSQGGIMVYGASARYDWNRQVSLAIGVVNLGDRAYSENGYTFNQPFNRTLSQPRTANASVTVRF